MTDPIMFLIIAIGVTALAATVMVVLYYRMADWYRCRGKNLDSEYETKFDSWKEKIPDLQLDSLQVIYLESEYFPRLAHYSRLSRRSHNQFLRLSRNAMVLLAVAVAGAGLVILLDGLQLKIGAAILAAIAVFGKLNQDFEHVQRNGERWEDCGVIAARLADALWELLTENKDKPIQQRWEHFRDKDSATMLYAQELSADRSKNAQAGSKAAISELREQVMQGREEFRGQPSIQMISVAPPTQSLNPERRTAKTSQALISTAKTSGAKVQSKRRIPGTNMPIDKYIERSMGGTVDAEGVIGSEAWPNE